MTQPPPELVFTASSTSGLTSRRTLSTTCIRMGRCTGVSYDDRFLRIPQVTALGDEDTERLTAVVGDVDSLPAPTPDNLVFDASVATLIYDVGDSVREVSISDVWHTAKDDPRADRLGKLLSDLRLLVAESSDIAPFEPDRLEVSVRRNDTRTPETRDWPLDRDPATFKDRPYECQVLSGDEAAAAVEALATAPKRVSLVYDSERYSIGARVLLPQHEGCDPDAW